MLFTGPDLATLLFYAFSGTLLASAIGVIAARNPVHSVLFLIFGFFNAAGLFVLIGAEYLAMTLVIVYVGAVAVLFLFVVMMMDVNFAALRQGFLKYLPLGGAAASVLFLLLMAAFNARPPGAGLAAPASPAPDAAQITNTEALGRILYTDYLYAFQLAGLILLVAMIGAIVLSLRERPGVRRQRVSVQNARDPRDCITLVKVKPGQGI